MLKCCCFFHFGKPVDKFFIGPFQRIFSINLQKPCKIYNEKKTSPNSSSILSISPDSIASFSSPFLLLLYPKPVLYCPIQSQPVLISPAAAWLLPWRVKILERHPEQMFCLPLVLFFPSFFLHLLHFHFHIAINMWMANDQFFTNSIYHFFKVNCFCSAPIFA